MEQIFFISYVAYLLRSAFDNGWPLRGGIDYGEMHITGNIFAGKPFINSFKLSQRLQFSGCALTPNYGDRFNHEISKFINLPKSNLNFLTTFLAPLKGEQEQQLYLVNWLCPFQGWEIPLDLRQYVADKFYAHNKDISRVSLPELENTEMTLRYFSSKRKKG